MEQEELVLTLLVPGGQETSVTVNSSKPVMDLLISLCAQFHLNPSDHIIELISANQNHIKFKPNSLIGSLKAERVVLKSRGSEDNNKMVPNMPLATVRLMINYRQCHKAVVRVNPRVPLAELMPAVCDKCEFDPNTTILMRDSQSEHPLDLTKTLNDYGIRELYAKDTKVVSSAPKDPDTPCRRGSKKEKLATEKKGRGEKENRGFFCLFRRSKKTAVERAPHTSGAPMCPLGNHHHVADVSCPQVNSATPTDIPKKRRAPEPPRMPCSQSFNQTVTLPSASGKERTKRRAPPPPCINPSLPDCSAEGSCCVGFAPKLTSLDGTQEEAATSHSSSSKQYIGFTAGCPSIQPPSLMTEILHEYMDIVAQKAQKKEELSSDGSDTYLPLAAVHSPSQQSVSSTPASVPDSDAIAPPGCGLPRYCYQKEGLTTFTVVPRKRQPSLRQYEILVMLEAQGSLEQSSRQTDILEPIYNGTEDLERRNSGTENLEPEESENPKLNSTETVTPNGKMTPDGKCKSIEEGNGELGILEAAELTLNADTETHHQEEKEKMEDQVAGEGERDYLEQNGEGIKTFQEDGSDLEWKNNEAEHLEPKTGSLEMNSVEMMGSEKPYGQSVYLEERNGKLDILEATEKVFGKLTHMEKRHPEETEDPVLKEEEQDWVKEYTERRRRFQGDVDDRKAANLGSWMTKFEEQLSYRKMEGETVEMKEGLPHPPPLSVYLKESEIENHEREPERKVRLEAERHEDFSTMHSKPSSSDPIPDILDSCCAVSLCSNLHSSDSKTFAPLTIQPPDHSHSMLDPNASFSSHQLQSSALTPPPFLHLELDSPSKATFHSTVEPSSPSNVSLFALAVSQRARSLSNRVLPLTPPAKGFTSQTSSSNGFNSPPPCSQTAPFTKNVSTSPLQAQPSQKLGSCKAAARNSN